MEFLLHNSIIDGVLIYLPIYIGSFIIYVKSLNANIKPIVKLNILVHAIVILTLTLIVEEYNYIYARLAFVVLTSLSIILFKKPYSIYTIPLSIISIGLSHCFQMIALIIVSLFLSFTNYETTNNLVELFVAIITISLSILFMHTKRFRNGILFFKNESNYGIGLFLSGIVLVIVCIIGNTQFVTESFALCLFIGSLISLIGLFLWIRNGINQHYRKKLQTKAEEHYQITLAEKERYIEQLTNSNTYLSKVVHRDNHLMSSLQYSIEQFKNCDDENEKDKILNEIITLANERGDLLLKEQKSNKLLAGTGSPIIDGALGNMYVKAAAHNIDFDLVVNEEVHYLINNIISQTDLETLLCDHIKDAIIAIEADDNIAGKILVTIEMVDNIYEISIKDNGVDFDVDTFSKLGLERVTTHKDTGGSGIGFMTTFESLEKTNASLIIIEYENKIPFSKSITFRFDGLKSFIIKSYRSDELKEYINRNDMIII